MQCPEHCAEPKWPGKNIPGRGTSRCKGRKVTTSLGSCRLCTGCSISGLSFSFVKRKLCPSQAGGLEGSLGAFWGLGKALSLNPAGGFAPRERAQDSLSTAGAQG